MSTPKFSNIQWTADNPDAGYSGWSGVDENGNKYWMPSNRETAGVTLADGRTGCGWTPEEAFENALLIEIPISEPAWLVFSRIEFVMNAHRSAKANGDEHIGTTASYLMTFRRIDGSKYSIQAPVIVKEVK